MKKDRLLAHYERIADAPNATAHLRRFILDLAVHGKLVPHDPKDEPASELLKRIAVEKARLVNNGEIKKEKPLPEIERDEAPFDPPPGWEWVPIRKITSDRGQVVPDQRFTYIDVTAINNEVGCIEYAKVLSAAKAPSRARKIVCRGDLLYSCVRPYLLNIAIVEEEISPRPIASTAFAILNGFGLVVPRYQWIVLRSPFFVACVEQKMRGQAYPAINDSDFSLLPFPLPPLAEQHRIAAKVDELMAICDRLEAARAARETVRDRLSASSLARLNATDPETFQANARFALDALRALTTRPDQIKQIRQTILNLAARGKLVPQDGRDVSAAELLKRIAKEKALLLKANAIPRQKEAVRDPTKLTEGLPLSWSLIALGDVCSLVTSGSRGWAKFYAKSGPGFIRAQNIRFGKLRLDDMAYVNPPSNSEGTRTQVIKGDLLIVITGAWVTNPALLDRELGEAYISQHVALVRPTDRQLSNWLLLCLMADGGGREELVERAYGAGKPGLNLDNIRSLSIPLPPLAEQHRIVAKVGELMTICDRLEANLIATALTRRRLLDALLADALAPHERALEAAE